MACLGGERYLNAAHKMLLALPTLVCVTKNLSSVICLMYLLCFENFILKSLSV